MRDERLLTAGHDPYRRLLASSYGARRRASQLRVRSRRAAYLSLLYMTAAARQGNAHRALQRARGRFWYRFVRMRGGGAFDRVLPVTFTFSGRLARGARRVSVVGPFNQWNPAVHPLGKNAEGDWTITVYLPPGRTIYHFDVDGVCWLDPTDDGRVPNQWGSYYSVRDLTANSSRSPAPVPPVAHAPISGGAEAVDPILESAPTPSLEYRVERRLEVCLLHVRGEIDLARGAQFEAALHKAVAPGRPVVLSLREIRYLDSTALHCLSKLRARLSLHHRRLVLAEPSHSVRRVIELAGFDDVFPIFSSIDGAVRYLVGTAQDEMLKRE